MKRRGFLKGVAGVGVTLATTKLGLMTTTPAIWDDKEDKVFTDVKPTTGRARYWCPKEFQPAAWKTEGDKGG